jgi:hypothetical protein
MNREYAVIVRDGTLELVKVEQPITLEYIQGVVGGYIEIAYQRRNLQVYCNEEGKLMGLPLNVMRLDGEPLVGPLIVLAGDDEGNTLPLTQEEAQSVVLLGVGMLAPLLTIK